MELCKLSDQLLLFHVVTNASCFSYYLWDIVYFVLFSQLGRNTGSWRRRGDKPTETVVFFFSTLRLCWVSLEVMLSEHWEARIGAQSFAANSGVGVDNMHIISFDVWKSRELKNCICWHWCQVSLYRFILGCALNRFLFEIWMVR